MTSGSRKAAGDSATEERMTEQNPEQNPESEPQGNPAEDLGEAGKKAIAAMKAERNQAKAEAAALKERLDKLEAANMSELERAQKSAEEARAEAQRATVSAFREAAVTFGGIPADDAELFLTANDVETLSKQAQRLAARNEPVIPGGPRPDLSQGARASMPLNGDPLEDAVKSALGIR